MKNLTPHTVVLNNGIELPASGIVARVSSELELDNKFAIGNNKSVAIFKQVYGAVVNLPEPNGFEYYIVSAIVLEKAKALGRTDCLAPATGHPDCVRNEQGQIVSVPGFVR